MKELELKDFNYCQDYIVAYKNGKFFIPCFVNIQKDKNIYFIKSKNVTNSPLKDNVKYDIRKFRSFYKGKDITGKDIYEVVVFSSLKESTYWCNVENELIKKYESD